MTSALFVVGACYLVTAACLPGLRRSARIVLLVTGLSGIGIAASPQPVHGSNPQHLVWTALGAVALAVWPAFTARRAPSQPLILRPLGVAAVTVVSLALLTWLVIETQGGAALGLAERLVTGLQMTWPLVVILALRGGRVSEERPHSVFRTDRCAELSRSGLTSVAAGHRHQRYRRHRRSAGQQERGQRLHASCQHVAVAAAAQQ